MATRDVERRALEDDRFYSDEIERLRLLLDASSTLLGSLSVEGMLPDVLELASRTLAADAYALWRFDARSETWAVGAHSGLSPEYVETATQAIVGNTSIVSLEQPIIAEDISATEWLNDAHRRAHAAEGTRSMLAAPLRYGDRVVGTVTFYFRTLHRFTEAEKSSASLLANLAAAAIGAAELYEEQERLAEDQRFVAQASELLASSLEYERTLANVAALAVPQFADWCTIDMVGEDRAIQRLAVAHVDPEKVRLANELTEKYPPDPNAPYGVPNVIRTRRAELFSDIPDELLVEATLETPELLEVLRELGLRSSMCVPLISRDRVLGAITFVSAATGRRYDEHDLAVAQDLARRAATAVDNALLFREGELARRDAQDSLAVVDAVFGAAPVGLAFMDTNFRYVRVNNALAGINGIPAEEHFGRTLRDVLGDELAEGIEPYHRQVLETGEPILDLPTIGRTAAAPEEVRNWLVSYYPVRDAGDAVIGVGVVITDVTDREEARAAAEAAGERLRVLAEASQQLASSLDHESTLANLADLLVPRFADWYAVDVADGDRFRRIAVVHKDPRKAKWAERSMTLFAPEPDELEGTARVVRTGEAVLYREISDELLTASTLGPEHHETLNRLGMASAMCVPLTAGGRTFGALMLVSSDANRLFDEDDLDFAKHLGRRAAVAVDNARLYREAERRARAALVVEHVADGVVLVNNEGVIRLWNPAAEHITGLSASDALGLPAAEVFADWGSIEALSQTDELRASTQAVTVNGRELWFSITGVGFDTGSVYAFRDLTEERAVETLKADFVSTISHELRTPLAAIYGSALTLRREDVQLGEPQRLGLLEVIASESDRLARIVNDVLWVSRLESEGLRPRIQPCDPVALATTVVEAARQYTPPSIKLDLAVPKKGLPQVAADPDKVRQVLTNLVDNAIKYSPDGGRVTLKAATAGRTIRFSVSDEGLGVPPAEHRRIFEKFYRLDPDLTRGVGGTGLGLYISRELLERMQGRIWVESSGRGGSTFVAELPMAD
ncbi:MAG: GAF domain-containing protein [Gaiellaceae bacterium]